MRPAGVPARLISSIFVLISRRVCSQPTGVVVLGVAKEKKGLENIFYQLPINLFKKRKYRYKNYNKVFSVTIGIIRHNIDIIDKCFFILTNII